MKHLSLAAAVVFASLSLPAVAQKNILLIIADDMGHDASNCYSLGNQQAPMPTLENLCKQGLVFDNVYAAPTCSPTRATIISGQYGFRTGVGAPVAPDGRDELAVDTPTLFDALNKVGYASSVIGKWHVSGADKGFDAPSQMGVSNYFGIYRGGTKDYFDWRAIENGERVRVKKYATTEFTDRAINWIDQQDNPWFLWLAYNAPHAPFHLPPTDLHSFDDLADSKRAARSNPLPYYQAMLEALDTEIGRLLSSMDQEERDNTVVIFIGDNGSPNQVTRGFYGDHKAKGTIYDSGTRVPLMVTGPGIKPGRTDALVNSTDLFATISALAGAQTSAPDSVDFSQVLTGESEGVRDFVYVEHFTNRKTKGGGLYGWALREGDYKTVNPKGQPPELYNVIDDPREQNNLLADGGNAESLGVSKRLKARQEALVATK